MNDENFTQIVHEYQKLVFGICVKLTGDYFAAQDLAQETFLAEYRSRNQFDGENAKAWICRIAANKCIDYNREAARRMVPTEDELLESSEAPDHSPEQIYMEREVRQKLDARCRSLKEPYGEVARMYFCEEKKAEDIALVKKISVKTVQTQIYRARDMLREIYRKEGTG